MLIRKYQPSDLETCAILIETTSRKYNKDDIIPGNEENFFGFFSLESNKPKISEFFLNANTLVAINEEGEIVGVMRTTENRIRSLFVALGHQRKGIATALFNNYVNNLGKEYRVVIVFSSSYAVNFYEHLGFKINGEKELRGNQIWSYPMKKILN